MTHPRRKSVAPDGVEYGVDDPSAPVEGDPGRGPMGTLGEAAEGFAVFAGGLDVGGHS
jgi:hypothetical protein